LKSLAALAGSALDGDSCHVLLRGTATGTGRQKSAGLASLLTDREIEVLELVSRGLTNRDVARQLVVSEKTVEHHLEHIFDKLDVTSRTAACVYAVQNGLVS
jgi:DNA-binding NarL/FixJ family response regulator